VRGFRTCFSRFGFVSRRIDSVAVAVVFYLQCIEQVVALEVFRYAQDDMGGGRVEG
jgi:hypothetical protein